MSITVDVSISDAIESADDVPDPSLLQSWASAAYLENNSAIVSLSINSADEIQHLNKEYRGKDKATNVLSFPMQSPEEVDICLLGDVVLCAEVIQQEAKQQDKAETSHWAHMVVHGMLHLQGYDHIKDEEAQIMEQLEIKILKDIGIDSPYQMTPCE